MSDLQDRQEEYERCHQVFLTRRLPIVIRITCRNFDRLIKNLPKPICLEMHRLMADALFYTITDIPGAVFGYCAFEESVIVLKNDQDFDTPPWLNNDLQKTVSVAASRMTRGFDRAALECDIVLAGDAIFEASATTLPYAAEVINALIWRQQACNKTAINSATFIELEKKFGAKTTLEILAKKSLNEKIDLLYEHTEIDFGDYEVMFRLGVGIYKSPTLVPINGESVLKNKWIIDEDIPNFINDKDFIYSIIINGVGPVSLDENMEKLE